MTKWKLLASRDLYRVSHAIKLISVPNQQETEETLCIGVA